MYQIGDSLEVKITNITNFGAFAVDENGTKGLIHISEISSFFVPSIETIMVVGDTVEVKILGFNEERGQLQLSYKALNDSVKSKRNFASQVEFAPLKSKLEKNIEDAKERFGIK